jgi:CheY-like chemotaxis protein
MTRWPMEPLVVKVQNGFEALVRIGLSKPDLLVTDLRMPEMDGFQMLRHLRAMPELADISIVVVTGLDPVEIEARGGIPEGIPILPKPVPFDRLRDIATVLAARKPQSRTKA